jgi:hypothetical protein
MNATTRRVLAIVALVCAILAIVGLPTGVPMLALAVILLAISLL